MENGRDNQIPAALLHPMQLIAASTVRQAQHRFEHGIGFAARTPARDDRKARPWSTQRNGLDPAQHRPARARPRDERVAEPCRDEREDARHGRYVRHAAWLRARHAQSFELQRVMRLPGLERNEQPREQSWESHCFA